MSRVVQLQPAKVSGYFRKFNIQILQKIMSVDEPVECDSFSEVNDFVFDYPCPVK